MTNLIIGICGGTSSGKTTLCKFIRNKMKNKRICVISMDSFYKILNDKEKKLAEKSNYNFDHPDSFDFELLTKVLKNLKDKRETKIPHYDFVTHSRLKKYTIIKNVDVIIIEGILLFHCESVRNILDIKIFVDADPDTRLVRRIRRDISESGREIKGILLQYEKFVKPSFDNYIHQSKNYSDIIVPNGGKNEIAIKCIITTINSFLTS